jgi:hypothetical protein
VYFAASATGTGRRKARSASEVTMRLAHPATCFPRGWPQMKIFSRLPGTGPSACSYGPPISKCPTRASLVGRMRALFSS